MIDGSDFSSLVEEIQQRIANNAGIKNDCNAVQSRLNSLLGKAVLSHTVIGNIVTYLHGRRTEALIDLCEKAFENVATAVRGQLKNGSNIAIINHYRSPDIPGHKMTCADGAIPRDGGVNRSFIETYESLQEGTRATLNSLLLEMLARIQGGFVLLLGQLNDCADACETFSCPNCCLSADAMHDNQTYRIVLGKCSRKLLLGEDPERIIDHIVACSKNGDSCDMTEKHLATILDGYRRNFLAAYWTKHAKTKDSALSDCDAVTRQLVGLRNQIYGDQHIVAWGTPRWDEDIASILRILQGMHILFEYSSCTELAAVTSTIHTLRDKDSKTRILYSDSLPLNVLPGHSRAAFLTSAQTFIFHNQARSGSESQIVNWIESYDLLHSLLTFRESIAHQTPTGLPSLSVELANAIIEEIDTDTFSLTALDATLQLCEMLSPKAVHEGRDISITLIVGRPHIAPAAFMKTSKLVNDKGKGIVKWTYKPWVRGTRLDDQKKLLSEAVSIIIGNHQFLQDSGKALFVECVSTETDIGMNADYSCTQLVELGYRRWSRYNAGDLSAFTRDNPNVVAIRLRGRVYGELWINGRQLLTRQGTEWGMRQTWDASALKDFLLKIFGNGIKEIANITDLVANVVVKISTAPNEGASFVIFKEIEQDKRLEREGIWEQCARMTVPFPNLCEGNFSRIQEDYDEVLDKLRNVAIQDGGTLIALGKDSRYWGRFQFTPVIGEKKDGQVQPPSGGNSTASRKRPFSVQSSMITGELWEHIIKEIGSAGAGKGCTGLNSEELKEDMKMTELWDASHLRYEGITIPNVHAWSDWFHVHHWGTRHLNSLGMSIALYERVAIVITVSADGGITVFHKGKAEDPKPKESK